MRPPPSRPCISRSGRPSPKHAPLYRNRKAVREALLPIAAALAAGALTAVVSALAIAHALGGSSETLASLAPKSATAPVAMGIAERIGGLPSLTAGPVILAGILGAVFATPLLRAFGIRDPRAAGFALGLTSHGLGTARAFQTGESAGAFAAIALTLTGLALALLAPPLTVLFRRWAARWLRRYGCGCCGRAGRRRPANQRRTA